MKIEKDMLRGMLIKLSKFLYEKKITPSEIGNYVGKRFFVDENSGEHIEITIGRSNLGTLAYVIDYRVPDKTYEGIHIPLEIRINEELGYSRIIIKGNLLIPDYEPFAIDAFGNVAQDKEIRTTNIALINSEFKKLIEYLGDEKITV